MSVIRRDRYAEAAERLLASPADEWTSALGMARPSRWDWPGRWRSFRQNVEATKAAIRCTLNAIQRGYYECDWERFIPGAALETDGENVTVSVRSWGNPLSILEGA